MRDLIEHELKCPDCGGEMWLKDSGEYGARYQCERYPLCRGVHGANQKTGAPLGTPGDANTRQARVLAHDSLDRIVRLIGKARAYRWLSTVLKIKQDQCHIALFDVKQCQRVIGAVNTYTRGKHG